MGCMIRVDPDEMASSSVALQKVAAELADLGSGVQSQCCSCCLPAGVEGEVMASAASVEASISGIAGDLGAQATDLSNRGAVAASDSLPTATSSASGAGSDVPLILSQPAADGLVVMGPGGPSQGNIFEPSTPLPVGETIMWVGGSGLESSPEEQAWIDDGLARMDQRILGSGFGASLAGPAVSYGDGGAAVAAMNKTLFAINESNSMGLIGLGTPSYGTYLGQQYAAGELPVSESFYGTMYPHAPT